MTRLTRSDQPRPHGLVPRFRYGRTDLRLRVSDAERAQVADRLAACFGEGRLDRAELDERVGRAMNATTLGDLSELLDDLPEPAPEGTPGTPVRGQHGPPHPLRPYVTPLFLVLLVVVITAVGTAGEAVLGNVPGVKTWLDVGVITAIVVFAAGALSRSRASRDE